MAEIYDDIQKVERICKNCANSMSGGNVDKRLCYYISGLRLILFGPRVVDNKHTCRHFCQLHRYNASKQRCL